MDSLRCIIAHLAIFSVLIPLIFMQSIRAKLSLILNVSLSVFNWRLNVQVIVTCVSVQFIIRLCCPKQQCMYFKYLLLWVVFACTKIWTSLASCNCILSQLNISIRFICLLGQQISFKLLFYKKYFSLNDIVISLFFCSFFLLYTMWQFFISRTKQLRWSDVYVW